MALRIESRPYLTNDFWLSHLPKDKTGGYNIGYLENLEKKGELFYVGIFSIRKSIIRACGDRSHRDCEQTHYTEPLQKIIERNR